MKILIAVHVALFVNFTTFISSHVKKNGKQVELRPKIEFSDSR